MNWITLYDIGAPHSVIWDDMLLILVCLIVSGKLISGIRMVMKNRKKRSIKDIVRIAFLSVILLLGILTLVFGWVDWKVKKFNPYEKAYTEGNLEVVTGKAENVEWYRGGFSFTLDNVNFHLDMGSSIKREKYIEPYFDEGYQLKIYYYGEEYFDPSNLEYEVLRIDVLIEDIPTE